MKELTQEQIINEYQKSIDSINGSVVQAYKTLESLKDNTYIEKSLPKMGILIDIKETWQKEMLENLYDSDGQLPVFQKFTCEKCQTVQWIKHSRVNPETYTEDMIEVDEENQSVKLKDPPHTTNRGLLRDN